MSRAPCAKYREKDGIVVTFAAGTPATNFCAAIAGVAGTAGVAGFAGVTPGTAGVAGLAGVADVALLAGTVISNFPEPILEITLFAVVVASVFVSVFAAVDAVVVAT